MSTQDTPDTSDAPDRVTAYMPGETQFVIAPQRTDVEKALDTDEWVCAKLDDTVEVRQ